MEIGFGSNEEGRRLRIGFNVGADVNRINGARWVAGFNDNA